MLYYLSVTIYLQCSRDNSIDQNYYCYDLPQASYLITDVK